MPVDPSEFSPQVFYCVECGNLGSDDRGHLNGTPFECPRSSSHRAEVVKFPVGAFWLRVEEKIAVMQRCSPLHIVRRAGLYQTLRFGILLGALLLASFSGTLLRTTAAVICIYCLYDIILLSTYATFVSRDPANPLRSLILHLVSFSHIALAYAVLYKLLSFSFNNSLTALDAVYFSVVTVTTVGYGDILPRTNGAKLLAVSELAFGLYLIAGLVAVVAGWANERPRKAPRRRSLAELRDGVTGPLPRE